MYRTDAINKAFGYLYAISAATQLYHTVQTWGLIHKVGAALTGRSYRLLDLETIRSTCGVHNRHYAGIQIVPVCQIRGSGGRCQDFDADFRPLQTHTKERWVRIAVARQAGQEMPPVKLVRIGDVYFVRDGHHRISVARALGQEEVEAEVMVWQIAGLTPWEPQVLSRALANQSMCQVACTRGKTSALRVI